MKFLKELTEIHSPSGEEYNIAEHILLYIVKNSKNWKVQPQLFFGDGFHDNLILKFGNPKTAIYSHLDTVGYTVRYGKELIPVGSPLAKTGTVLTGKDSNDTIECILDVDNDDFDYSYNYFRNIETGTTLTYKSNFRETEEFIQSPYLDNRLGVWMALKIAETLENGVIAFTTYEEHGGGGAEVVTKYICEVLKIQQSLILDITWITSGVQHGKGTVISLRDRGIPRKKYVEQIVEIAKKHNIKFQFEVERTGGSDGTAIQKTPYPVNWCFIGPPEDYMHSPDEYVNKNDISETIKFYKILMKQL